MLTHTPKNTKPEATTCCEQTRELVTLIAEHTDKFHDAISKFVEETVSDLNVLEDAMTRIHRQSRSASINEKDNVMRGLSDASRNHTHTMLGIVRSLHDHLSRLARASQTARAHDQRLTTTLTEQKKKEEALSDE